ncbi:MAG TPA: outer membrane beta-barrel protein, partial [Vicinamibacterales bacterium]|nr:outer membrane beta-barrel protein [Vicinamibacterales bacterium]
MNPRLEISNVGTDSNVFNEPTDQSPKSDFTATISPTTDLWLRLGRSWLNVKIKEDIVWFQKYASERSANTGYTIDWRMPLNRFSVDVAPRYASTRERPGFEIDARSQRTEYGGKATVEMRTFAKTFIGVDTSFLKTNFDKDAVFLGTNLQDTLNHTNTSLGLRLRHQLTPLTTVSLSVSQSQDRFEFTNERDANWTDASMLFTFDPHALLKGNATVGYKNFHPLFPGLPDYVGATAAGDLSYTLLGTTRMTLNFKRDTGYSFDADQPYYVQTDVGGSISQQIFGPFDVMVRGNAARLAYRSLAT